MKVDVDLQAQRNNVLWAAGFNALEELQTPQGILASGREEIYGCIFGRDSLISALFLLDVYRKTGNDYYRAYVHTILVNLVQLQGSEVVLASGEEPGKCIHEFRPERHEHLTARSEGAWYLYPDGIMRNYDTIDATPLLLMAIHEYYAATGDEVFLTGMLPHVERALEWVFLYGDSNGDNFIDYRLHAERTHGGLATQSWMDSVESRFHEEGAEAPYPIAPVEAQAYLYAALCAWSDTYRTRDLGRSDMLASRAQALKTAFNQAFIFEENGAPTLAFALDGNGRPMRAARSSMGHTLFAAYQGGGIIDGILDEQYVQPIVQRLLQPDLFVAQAGMRTLSTRSHAFEANSYHNGSIWPHDTAMIALGLSRFGYLAEAQHVREALQNTYAHFQTPLELFVYDNDFGEYIGPTGQRACRVQAWSACALLSLLTDIHPVSAQSAEEIATV